MNFADIVKRDYISPSAMNTFGMCGCLFEYVYCEGRREAPGIAMIAGTGTHSGVEHNMTSKRDTGMMAPLNDCLDVTASKVEERFEKEEVKLEEGESKGVCIDNAVRFYQTHHQELAPAIDPMEVERKLWLTIDGVPIRFFGIADLIERGGVVRDLKTSGKKKSQNDIDHSYQFTMYDWAYEQEMGASLTGLYMDVCVSTKTKAYSHTLETVRTDAHRQEFVDYAEIMIKATEAGIFLPAERGYWKCSEKWCGFFNECKFGRRNAVTI